MATGHNVVLTAAAMAFFAAITICLGGAIDDQQTGTASLSQADQDQQVLTRGPVHEGFAQPILYNPKPATVIATQPPEAIDELPPSDAPKDPLAVWLAGYWSWDDETHDFVWVSGCWRIPPTGYEWVQGYWQEVEDGWQWVSGRWQLAGAGEPEYLPTPPASLDVGPSSPAASEDMAWAPGEWTWRDGGYRWTAGFWVQFREERVWVPHHYAWTPRGCVLVGGYWDYPLANRGVLFAPARFGITTLRMPSFQYSPSVVMNTQVVQIYLFCRPGVTQYFFGDYYAPSYVTIGYFPWWGCQTGHRWYDPMYQHESWRHRKDDPQWDRHNRADYADRLGGKSARPARTTTELQTQLAKTEPAHRKDLEIAQPLRVVAANKTGPIKFETITTAKRQELANRAKDLQTGRPIRPDSDKIVLKPVFNQPTRSPATARPVIDDRPTPANRPTDPRMIDKTNVRPDRNNAPVIRPAGPSKDDSAATPNGATWARPLPERSRDISQDTPRPTGTPAPRTLPESFTNVSRPSPRTEVVMPREYHDSGPMAQPAPSHADRADRPAAAIHDTTPPPAEARPVAEPRHVEAPAAAVREPAPAREEARSAREPSQEAPAREARASHDEPTRTPAANDDDSGQSRGKHH